MISNMVKELISNILSRFDYAIMDATVRFKLREQNLDAFYDLVRAELWELIKEFPEGDSRVTFEEKNAGFMIYLNGDFLFRVGVCKYSERVEVIVDSERYLRYDGIDPYHVNNFSSTHKPIAELRIRILEAFAENVTDYLRKQISKL